MRLDVRTSSVEAFFLDRLPQVGYTVRESQLKLAKAVETAVNSRRPLLAEADVGTGKTFAYMIPALLAGKDLVVSTNTILLQEQLLTKDVPALRHLGWPHLRAVVAKGRGQYLCLQRLDDPKHYREARPEELRRLETWVRLGGFDRNTLEGVSDQTWKSVAMGYRSDCARCLVSGSCATFKERMRWREPGAIAISNHGQLVQVIAQWASGREGIFPRPGVLVIDEAHHFISAVREHLTRRIGLESGLQLMGALEEVVQRGNDQLRRDATLLEQVLTLILQDIRRVKSRNPSTDDDSDRYLIAEIPGDLLEAIAYAGDLAAAMLADLQLQGSFRQAAIQLTSLVEACEGLIEAETVKWVEPSGDVQALAVLNEDPSDWLQRTLFQLDLAVVFVSATLSVGGDFSYIQRQLGEVDCDTLSVPGPFDYDHQVQVLTDHGGQPYDHHHPEVYYQRVFQQTAKVIEETQGDTLVLFTSRRALEKAKKYFERHALSKRFPMLFQGDTGTASIVDQFRALKGSCLFGTSFWEGLDVPGDHLRAVVVTKLPYPAPDPLLQHELEQAEKRREDPYCAVILPRMMLKLKQGLGRLIRSESDRGTAVILDPRFVRQRFRWQDVLPFRKEPVNSDK